MKKPRRTRKRTRQKQRGGVSKWVLPTLPRSALRRMDSDTLNKYAKLYKVKAIPVSFILDEKGVIVAKNLRGSKLEAKVSELLDVK